MRLSEAIRLGAALGPQMFGDFYGPDGGSCAYGAAIKGSGLGFSETMREWPVLRIDAKCPVCWIESTVMHMIPHLNDEHRWSRERIADFVELHEPVPGPEIPADVAVEARDAGRATV